jgi:hypothetical protein
MRPDDLPGELWVLVRDLAHRGGPLGRDEISKIGGAFDRPRNAASPGYCHGRSEHHSCQMHH